MQEANSDNPDEAAMAGGGVGGRAGGVLFAPPLQPPTPAQELHGIHTARGRCPGARLLQLDAFRQEPRRRGEERVDAAADPRGCPGRPFSPPDARRPVRRVPPRVPHRPRGGRARLAVALPELFPGARRELGPGPGFHEARHRRWEAQDPGQPAAAAEERGASGAHVLPDDKDDGHSGGLLLVPKAPIPAAGRLGVDCRPPRHGQ
mmetsp:Transcript_60754/g.144592  ORF Transcript_60754/g.144592 Transcript_60754/m.144592 type:complete len:205 (+) Transcript_60754:1612-2226(+)